MLNPDDGVALGTVTAQTRVECVSVHKCVLQTFAITDAFLEGVKARATRFPGDLQLDGLVTMTDLWGRARRQLVQQVFQEGVAVC